MLAKLTTLHQSSTSSHRFWFKTSVVFLGLFWASGYALAQLQQRSLATEDKVVQAAMPVSEDNLVESIGASNATPSIAKLNLDAPPEVNANAEPNDNAIVTLASQAMHVNTVESKLATPTVSTTDAVKDPVVELVAAPAENNVAVAIEQAVTKPTRPPVFVAIHNDMITFEFSAEIAKQQTAMMRALARAMLTDQLFQEDQWLSTQPLNLQARPTLYRRVLDHRHDTVTTPIQAHAYAQFLIQRRLDWVERQGQPVAQIRIPLSQSNLPAAAQPYEAYVLRYANEYKISPALVFAVMEVESNFNPRAISRSNAMGLMQIKDYAAGLDVYQKVDGINQMPSRNTLFNPEQNIRIGTAYLALLYHDYFAAVNDAETRSALVIAAYNGGLNRVWPLFGNDMESAMWQVNRLSTAQVKQRISQQHSSAETRNYLTKVLNTQAHYQAWLGRDAQPLLAAR
ncbi:murein transglycosylase domain-containing protein [Thiomicrospira sp. ALE5]|uniref:murein transglycosylase domain-containing protein n=1 Tax=Thiomicrospira sp. ALE5 TaxID=748650 RepID=UPI0008EBF15C|nr:murein transglycosylase domain-containing protein [Thiomicrospira sp. ALE5]SFR59485.1 membrane-bound lytic murein transglycosylase C [Thiomicrospira sp. ALE5]